MTFLQFEAFDAVARHMNITKAAQQLHTSQPSLSRHLKALERNYKVRLFTRNGKGIELTKEGAEFLTYIEPILAQLNKIERRFLKQQERKATLIVGATYALSVTFLPSLIALFKRYQPNVDVVLRSNTSSSLEQLLLRGEIELALTSAAPRRAEILAQPCVPLQLIAFAAKGYPLPKRNQLSLADLEKIPLIIRDDGNRRGTTETLLLKLQDLGYRPNIFIRCESPDAIKTAVNKKLGVGILIEDLLRQDLARGLFKTVHIQGICMEANTYVFYHKQRSLSPCAEIFLKLLRQWCEEKEMKRKTAVGQAVESAELRIFDPFESSAYVR
jgi:DNA-binding transcriptional LysR family regulator